MKPIYYVLLSFLIVVFATFWISKIHGSLDYVRGAYGKVCTLKGQENPRIRYKVYYATFEECDKAAQPFK